ncbi:MAG TPA: coenzyme F420-0:L-glutamate ligase, partial [Burkholderiales bacterium]|nr:coenzyme F420-0:L-glutamate ligase [Burkholderiales bacterium]
MRTLTLTALPDIPEIERGMALAPILMGAVNCAGLRLEEGDVLVIAQKIISKAEGRRVLLSTVEPSQRAIELAASVGKEPRMVELMLRESHEVLRATRGVLIVEHRLGFVMASAGIDQSNVPGGGECVLLLPEDPDASARRLSDELRAIAAVEVGIVINDSFGRAWRNGVVGIAIGVAGVPALIDMRGKPDRQARALEVTQVAAADELAAAASLVMGQAAEGTPAVLARGFPYARRESRVQELIRP